MKAQGFKKQDPAEDESSSRTLNSISMFFFKK